MQLHEAVADKDIRRVRRLLRQGADVNAPDEDGATPLHYAAAEGDIQVIRLLLEAGAAPCPARSSESAAKEVRDPPPNHVLNGSGAGRGKSSNVAELHEAAADNDIQREQGLLNELADVNVSDGDGAAPPYYAAERTIHRGRAVT